jgi:hypothetical protein
MRKTGKTLVLAAVAAVAAGMTSPALAATARHEPVSRSAVAFTPGSGRSVVDWNRELITILGTPGAQPAIVHPTRSFAILQAAEYDAVTSITRAAPSYRFRVPAPRGARPDAAADQAAHDVLTALYPALKTGPNQLLAGELAAIPDGQGKQQGIRVGEIVVTRTFGSFQAAANEATLSRIFAGQHTMIDLVAGQQLGHHVADFVLHHLGSAPADAR